jgi:hypothetical protein
VLVDVQNGMIQIKKWKGQHQDVKLVQKDRRMLVIQKNVKDKMEAILMILLIPLLLHSNISILIVMSVLQVANSQQDLNMRKQKH